MIQGLLISRRAFLKPFITTKPIPHQLQVTCTPKGLTTYKGVNPTAKFNIEHFSNTFYIGSPLKHCRPRPQELCHRSSRTERIAPASLCTAQRP